jgi:hypothetical protein
MKRKNRSKIRTISKGMKISIPIRRPFPVMIERYSGGWKRSDYYELPHICSILLFLVWSLGMIMLIDMFFFDILPPHILPFKDPAGTPKVFDAFVVGTLLVWALGEGYLLYALFSEETLLFLSGQVSIGESLFGMNLRQTRYAMQKIRHLHVDPEKSPQLGRVVFEYEGQIIRYGKNIDTQEAEYLVQIWTNLMTSHYHSVKRIIFGVFPLIENNPFTTARNIDFSTVTFPFVHVTQILIDTTTYDFHQLEQFLTYAVNYMKPSYLKHHVEVYVYGDPKKLHPNLRNNLTNLCKRVQRHNPQDELQVCV